MARTTAEGEVGREASGSRSSRAARRRQRRRRATPTGSLTPSMATTRSREAQLESPPTSQQPESPPPSQRGKRRGRAARERSKSPKRARAAGNSDEENTATSEQEAAAASASPPAEHASSRSSSELSSPIRWPILPRNRIGVDEFGEEIFEPFHMIDPTLLNVQQKLKNKFIAKQDRQLKLVSLEKHETKTCLVDPTLLPVREHATKIVLQAAKFVLSLSSYIDGKLLRRCSGFLIDWDKESKVGTVMTSAHVIRSKSPSLDEWLAKDEYAPHAEVHAHLLDKADTTVVAELLRYDKHYNIALFKIIIDLSTPIPPFTTEIKCAQEVFLLGRNEWRHLTIDHGSVNYMDPSSLQRHHYMFVTCGINELVIGGPVVDFHGRFVGMVALRQLAIIPSSIILKCLNMWKRFNCIPRLHVGMKFSAVVFLDPSHMEKISRRCDVDAGLIVKQVSYGSVAERAGVRPGDIIKSWNGENISTTVELENFLLHTCEKHMDKTPSICSNVELSVAVFNVRKESHGTVKLTVNLSTDVEVVERGSYCVTPAHCSLLSDDVVEGEDPWDASGLVCEPANRFPRSRRINNIFAGSRTNMLASRGTAGGNVDPESYP